MSEDVEVHGSLVYTEVQTEEGAHRAGSWGSLQRKGGGCMAQSCRGAIRKALGQRQQEEFLPLHGQYSWIRKMCLSGAEDLVTVEAGGNEGLCLLCSTVHQEGLQAPELRDGAQGGEDPVVLEEN